MRKISWSCIVIGVISILLSISAIPFGKLNLPFKFLIDSLSCGSIAVPKLSIFLDILRKPAFDYIFSIVLFISGIGTVLTKRWGKNFAYIFAMSIFFLSIIGMFIILPGYILMYSEMARQGSLSLLPVFFGGGGYFLTFLSTLLYPIVLLIFFSLPKIKERFAQKR